MQSKYCTRDESALAEATARPIFLFQSRRWIITAIPEGYDCEDGEVSRWIEEKDEYETLTGEQLSKIPHGKWDVPCAIEEWDTERVFLTRQEATKWAEAHHYRWPDGWRVYCVCAEGELAAAIEDGSEIPGNRVLQPASAEESSNANGDV